MRISRRIFCITLGSLVHVPGVATAAGPDPAEAARRRFGTLARRTLHDAEIADLLAQPVPERSDPVALAARIRADFDQDRTFALGGWRFARTEVVLFLRA